MNFSELLAPLDSILKKCRVSYAIIGGYAVAAWGEERATRDIDLLCGGGSSGSIVRELKEAGLNFEHRTGDFEDPISEVIRIEIGAITDPGEIDLLIGVRGAPPGILERTRIVHIENLAVPVASPEDMVILKLLAGSARDLEDAKSIIDIQGNRMDLNLLRRICPEQARGLLERLLPI